MSKSKASLVVVWEGGNGGGAWRHAFDAVIPWYQILVSCSDWSNVFMLTDSQCGWQYCALSMSRSCYFGRRFFKRQILSKQYKFLCKTFRLSLLQEEQKICLWSVAKRKTKHSTNKAFLALSSDKLRSHLQRNGLINRRSNGTALQSRSWQERDKTQKSRMTMAKSHACKKETSARRLVQR